MRNIEGALVACAALALASADRGALAESPPPGWHEGEAPPAQVSQVFALDVAPLFEVQASLDVRLADLPLATEGRGEPKALFVADDVAPFPRDWKPGVHGVMQFTVKAWTGIVRLNDEVGTFGPTTWWSMGVKHQRESTEKNTGPFSFDVLSGFDSIAGYATPSSARFDHAEGTVEPDFSTHTSRWLTGDAAPTAWGVARAIRIPGERGESVAVFVGSSPLVLGGPDRDASAMVFLEDDARARLAARGAVGTQRWGTSTALLVDVSSDPADPVVHFRVVARPFFF